MSRRRASAAVDDRVTTYAQAVVSGALVVRRAARLSCERTLRDLARQHTASFPYQFDVAAAAHIVVFFEGFLTLEHGGPFQLLPWQQFCLGSLFGWLRTRDRGRRFQTAY